MSEKRFDEHIKRKLEGLRLDPEKAGWSAFSEKYSDQISQDNDTAFDDVIKDKMTALSASGSTGWDMFEAKLDKEVNDTFDTQIKDKIENLTTEFVPGHWQLMKSRLEHVLYVRKQLFTSKALEIVIAFLLFFALGNSFHVFLPNEANLKSAATPAILADAQVNENKSSAAEQLDKIIEEKTVKNTDQSQVKDKSIKVNHNLKSTSSKKSATAKKNDLNSKKKLSKKSTTTSQSKIIAQNIPVRESNESTALNTPIAITASSKVLAPVQQSEAVVLKKHNTKIELSPISAIPVKIVSDNKIYKPDFAALSAPIIELKKQKKNGLWFHTVLSTDMNLITSTYGFDISEESYRTQATGYSAGVLLGYETGRFGVNMGLKFGSYDYTPKDETIEYIRVDDSGFAAYYSINLTTIEHNTINIPVNFEYRLLPSTSKWNLFATAGASLNILSLINYKIEHKLTDEIGLLPLPPDDQLPESFTAKSYIKGWSQGGSFSETASLYLTAGIGIQRTFGNSLALFAVPSYQYQATNRNINPNGDIINRFSMNFGMKFKFQ